jgi:hypothetical protein
MRGTWQTTGGSGPSVGVIVGVIAAAWLIGSGALATIVHAIAVVLIILGCTVALAVAGGIAVLILRARQDRPVAPIPARPVYQVPPEPRRELSPPYKAATEPGRELHLHFHGLSAEQIAAVVTRSNRQLEE